MPAVRFTDAMLAEFKRVMLTRPDFKFTACDVQAIMAETGLNKEQVQRRAINFRHRYKTEKERRDFLTSEVSEKDTSVRLNRVSVLCFNVSPDFGEAFKFPKSKGEGDFTIKYMSAAFNKEAAHGAFFIEFAEKVWSLKLIERFEALGAGQVTIITFANNDGGESAADALAHIMTCQDEGDEAYSRGACQEVLLDKAQAKHVEAMRQRQQMSARELDEKTAAAIKASELTVVSTVENMQSALGEQLGAQGEQMTTIQQQLGEHGEQVVAAMTVGMSTMADKMDHINRFAAELEIKNETIKDLTGRLAHKTKECDRIESQKGKLTKDINKQVGALEELQRLLDESEDENVRLREMQAGSDAKLEEANRHIAELRAMQWYERAVKRQRIAPAAPVTDNQ